jgi:hypothetical protein
MKLMLTLGALVVVGLTSTPAFALFCADHGPSVGFEFEFSNGRSVQRRDLDAQRELDMQRLRSVGVYANSVERWNGCIRAYVDNGSGGEAMEFYDPRTLQRLQ